MSYYKETNTNGVITSVQNTPAVPEDTIFYRYTEITQEEYDSILADFAESQPEPPLDPFTQTQLAIAELAEAQEQAQTENQLALAELAEMLTGGVS